MNIPTAFASLISSEDDPPLGPWCCLGCREVTTEAEDYHIARCAKAQRLLKERERQYGDRRARHRED